ncbi:MAG: hypothetical protein F4Z29_07450 [Gemmatimonadetes bacterium]|nr:hypothetical protein [Gemmatimonadota bacterium]
MASDRTIKPIIAVLNPTYTDGEPSPKVWFVIVQATGHTQVIPMTITELEAFANQINDEILARHRVADLVGDDISPAV